MDKYSITNDSGEVTMRDLATGVTLSWMEGETNTMTCQSTGALRGSAYIAKAKEMTSYAYAHGLLTETTADTMARMVAKQSARREIGRQVKEARIAARMTIRSLADKCGIGAGHITRIECGRYNVSADTLAIIAGVLDTKITIEV
ncbi:helix-turn-helix domain-containing protein [Duncaniella muris]|nr:helix-turn-helix transcriptional regulator [Duncaniella muris]